MARAFFAALLFGSTTFSAPADRAVGPAMMQVHSAAAAPIEVAPPPRRAWDCRPGFDGWVTAYDRNSITVQSILSEMDSSDVRRHVEFQGRQRKNIVTSRSGKPFILRRPGADMNAIRLEASHEVYTVTSPDGTVTVIRRTDEAPKRFEVDEWLAGGGFDPALRHTDVYPLSAVQVGDVVRLRITHYEPFGGVVGAIASDNRYNICNGISIQRRPGGKVPPSWGENENDRNKHHERMQILQDWEEKGVPLPYTYHPGGLCPWPQLAPPPRLVKR